MSVVRRIRRWALRAVLMVAVPIVVIVAGLVLYAHGGRYVTAENAYVKADIVHIGSEVDGRVARLFVDDYQVVDEGQPLFQIDPEPFGIALAAAEADLTTVRQRLDALAAEYRQGLVEIAAAEEQIRYMNLEYERQKTLEEGGIGARSKLEEAEHDLVMAQREADRLKEENAMVLAELGGSTDLPAERHPLYLAALAKRDKAALDLARTLVSAPIAGTLSQIGLEVGEYVEAGDPVFALVATGAPWIEVNLKEVDLTYIRAGQPASVVVDAFPDETWRAHVAGISPATGAEFALLPPQNATGNWVKVVQRVPVRLELEPDHDLKELRSGMTVSVSIDTGHARDLGAVVEGVLADVLPEP
jgi:membrane fusion protein, multidrug efflux system